LLLLLFDVVEEDVPVAVVGEDGGGVEHGGEGAQAAARLVPTSGPGQLLGGQAKTTFKKYSFKYEHCWPQHHTPCRTYPRKKREMTSLKNTGTGRD